PLVTQDACETTRSLLHFPRQICNVDTLAHSLDAGLFKRMLFFGEAYNFLSLFRRNDADPSVIGNDDITRPDTDTVQLNGPIDLDRLDAPFARKGADLGRPERKTQFPRMANITDASLDDGSGNAVALGYHG